MDKCRINRNKKPTMSEPASALTEVREVIARHWGFRDLRPNQQEALQANLEGRDLLLVLPTGGGKSLCYQAPAAWRNKQLTLVVSPLISLMKDQVDALSAHGVPSVFVNSSLSFEEREENLAAMRQGKARLAFIAPERLVMPDFISFVQRLPLASIAIDEAHCISHWGHDFRPEYRQLTWLKEKFPKIPVHAFTATATEKVRLDIIEQLKLVNPSTIIGDFHRPNLTYRVIPRENEWTQVNEFLQEHRDRAGIIYCMRRKDVDDLVTTVRGLGFAAEGYHAGMTAEKRKQVHDDFRRERCNLIIATVAFGMGIDRPDVRFVLHLALPKSLEHYQQESGRAGRDGLDAECVLLYHRSDFMSWKGLLTKSADENDADPNWLPIALSHLEEMNRYCQRTLCRHRQLVGHFGQTLAKPNCSACDVCLGDAEMVKDSLITAQKLLSSIARCNERFGVRHLIDVLRGENTEGVLKHQHEKLSVFGLLRDQPKEVLRDWFDQLASQGLFEREEFRTSEGTVAYTLRLNAASWEVLRGKKQDVKLVRTSQPTPAKKKKRRQRAGASLPVDQRLFVELQKLRRHLADMRGVAPFIICHDTTLNELASRRPTTKEALRSIPGFGEAKIANFGAEFLAAIRTYCQQHGLKSDLEVPVAVSDNGLMSSGVMLRSRTLRDAKQLFSQGASISDVMAKLARAESTVTEYLVDYLREHPQPTPEPWLKRDAALRIRSAIEMLAEKRLTPLFQHFGGEFSYPQLKIALAWREF
jgi:ATP-dependent DNA helicase RecQ